jgi:hypothetical protein
MPASSSAQTRTVSTIWESSVSARTLGAQRPEPLSRSILLSSRARASSPIRVTIPDVVRRRRRKQRASDRSHSIPRPACGGAMPTLLRVRRDARLRHRPNLDGAFRLLRSAGSWQPSFRRSSRENSRWKADHSASISDGHKAAQISDRARRFVHNEKSVHWPLPRSSTIADATSQPR